MSRVAVESDESLRGTGRTTRLIRAAPQGAFFICLSVAEGRRRVSELGRHDLQAMHPDDIVVARWRGTDRLIVVDHAVRLTEAEAREVRQQNTRHADGLMQAMRLS